MLLGKPRASAGSLCPFPRFPPSFTCGPCSVPNLDQREPSPTFLLSQQALGYVHCLCTEMWAQKCLLYLKGCLKWGRLLQLIYLSRQKQRLQFQILDKISWVFLAAPGLSSFSQESPLLAHGLQRCEERIPYSRLQSTFTSEWRLREIFIYTCMYVNVFLFK